MKFHRSRFFTINTLIRTKQGSLPLFFSLHLMFLGFSAERNFSSSLRHVSAVTISLLLRPLITDLSYENNVSSLMRTTIFNSSRYRATVHVAVARRHYVTARDLQRADPCIPSHSVFRVPRDENSHNADRTADHLTINAICDRILDGTTRTAQHKPFGRN